VGKLPRVSGDEMIRFLQAQGFVVRRIRGSHHVVQRGTQHSTVPVHGNQALRIGTLRSILRDIELSPTEFEKLWR
jgi:predicted RNA binding protein YcfA (HicA-like mRNA interferase family)